MDSNGIKRGGHGHRYKPTDNTHGAHRKEVRGEHPTAATTATPTAAEADQAAMDEASSFTQGSPPKGPVDLPHVLDNHRGQRVPHQGQFRPWGGPTVTKRLQQITPENARDVLAMVRRRSPPPYDDLSKVIANSGGKLSTTEVFSNPVEGHQGKKPSYAQTERFLLQPGNWHPERAQIQQRLGQQRKDAANRLSDVMAAHGQPNTIVAVMGNTAAGKTTALRTLDNFAHLGAHLDGAINPDPIKADLVQLARKDGQNTISHKQAHQEGNVISQRVEHDMLKTKGASLVYDKRFAKRHEFSEMLRTAEQHDKKVQVVDIDSGLTRSVVRVLMRPVDSAEPRVPFNAVAEGFIGTRVNREEVLLGRPDEVASDGTRVRGFKGVIDNPRVTSYDLFVPDNKGIPVRVAYKRDGVWHGPKTQEQEQLFDRSVKSNPYKSVEVARRIVIDSNFIHKQVDEAPESFKAPMREALSRFQGMTLEQALDAHSKKIN